MDLYTTCLLGDSFVQAMFVPMDLCRRLIANLKLI